MHFADYKFYADRPSVYRRKCDTVKKQDIFKSFKYRCFLNGAKQVYITSSALSEKDIKRRCTVYLSLSFFIPLFMFFIICSPRNTMNKLLYFLDRISYFYGIFSLKGKREELVVFLCLIFISFHIMGSQIYCVRLLIVIKVTWEDFQICLFLIHFSVLCIFLCSL